MPSLDRCRDQSGIVRPVVDVKVRGLVRARSVLHHYTEMRCVKFSKRADGIELGKLNVLG
jgi:hypothetical protein